MRKKQQRIKVKELRGENLYELISESDTLCISQLCLDRRTFKIIVVLLMYPNWLFKAISIGFCVILS